LSSKLKGDAMKIFSSVLALSFLIILTSDFIYSQPVGINILWETGTDVSTMKFTPDGNLLVTGGKNTEINCYPYTCGSIKIWNIADTTLLNTLGNFSMGFPNDIDISSDGQAFISGHGSVYCSAFSGCSRDRAGQFEFTLNGSQVNSNTNPDGIIYSIAYSPDNNVIASGTGYNNSGHINIYDSQFNLIGILAGHSARTTSLVFTPDGQHLISGGYDGYIRVWNYNSGDIVTYFQHGTYLNGGTDINLSLSPDGQYLASTGNGYNLKIKIWKTSDWSVVHTIDISHPYGSGSSIVFSPNSKYLASRISNSSDYGLIRFYSVETGEPVREYIDSSGVRTIALSSAGNNYFAYSVGYGNNAFLRIASTDLNLVEDSITPVELAGFNANVSNNNVVLNWITSSELNNSGFEVQRLHKTKGLQDWATLGFVEGRGTTSETNYYTFDDRNLSAGNYQYRLKQLDFNGAYEYSDMIEVVINKPDKYSLAQNYPNPFNPNTTIEYFIPSDGLVTLKVYNSLGEEISVLIDEFKSAGKYSVTFNDEKLPSGLYLYSLKSSSYYETRKMLLLK